MQLVAGPHFIPSSLARARSTVSERTSTDIYERLIDCCPFQYTEIPSATGVAERLHGNEAMPARQCRHPLLLSVRWNAMLPARELFNFEGCFGERKEDHIR